MLVRGLASFGPVAPVGQLVDQATATLNSRYKVQGNLEIERLDLFLRCQFVETLPRLHRRAGASGPLRRIDFRHVIESLRRKPRALLRAQLQADILPDDRGEAAPELLLPDQHNLEQGSGVKDCLR